MKMDPLVPFLKPTPFPFVTLN